MKVKNCSHEGCTCARIWSKGLCRYHFMKENPPKPLNRTPIKTKVTPKQKVRIKENKEYYKAAILLNIVKNKGVCRCDECGEEIKSPFGKNHGRLVCHVIGSGANAALYHDKENHFILGRGELFGECSCGAKFDESGHRHEMKINKQAEEIRQRLTLKYYMKKATR